MGGVCLGEVLARIDAPGTEYAARVERLESMCRTAMADLVRIMRLAARAQGASGDDLEDAVQAAAAQVVRLAAERAVDAHRSALPPRRRKPPGRTAGT